MTLAMSSTSSARSARLLAGHVWDRNLTKHNIIIYLWRLMLAYRTLLGSHQGLGDNNKSTCTAVPNTEDQFPAFLSEYFFA
jgi:hypothetical protein